MSQDIIRKAYYDPNQGFIGIEKLYRKLQSEGITRTDIGKFLKKQEVYQVNKKNNQKSASFIPRYPLQEFQIDLIYLDDSHLNQAKYGLCCIDAFSKKAEIELMPRRTKEGTVSAMVEVLDRMGLPDMIYCDEGSEFNNAPFKRMCAERSIKLVFTIRHAPIVERFNRTIKEMISKYLQSTNSKTVSVVLPKIIANYNNSFHSSIGMAPNEVTLETQHIAQINLLKHLNSVPYRNIEVGDKVRVQVKPKSFVKGYRPKYSKQIYEVTEKGDGYYKTTKDERKYLKSNLQVVGEAEMNPEPPDYEGSREAHLRGMRGRVRPQPEEEAEEEEEEPIAARPKRQRAPVNYVMDDKYGKIVYG